MSEPPGPPDEPPPSYPSPWCGGYPPQQPHEPYASQPYPSQQPYPPGPQPPAPAAPARVSLGDRARVRQRPAPRFSTSIAAVGAALVLVGVLVWAGGYLAAGIDFGFDDSTGRSQVSGTGRRFLGVALAALLVAGGYTLLVLRRRGPLATAGVVVSAFGVPVLLLFLTFDLGGGEPVNLDAIYVVSIIVWLASYVVIPGAQGRSFYLGAAALGFASYVALKAGGDETLVRAGLSASNLGGDGFGGGSSGAVTAVGLIFGLGYYALAALLDRRGRHGAAVGLVVAAFFTTTSGIGSAATSFGQAGTGALLLVLGLALTFYGGWAQRRFTTWVWAFGFVVGVGLVVQKALPDSYTGAGIVLIIVGVAVAAAAQVVAVATREAPDIDEPDRPAAEPAHA